MQIYGLHAVMAALANADRTPLRLRATRNALQTLQARGAKLPTEAEIVSPGDIAACVPSGTVHQGVLLETTPLPEISVAQACAQANRLLILDQVTDPRNVGAVLRCGAVLGADALILGARNAPPFSGVLAKAASGGLEHVKTARAANLARALETVRQHAFTVIGLDGDAQQELHTLDLTGPVALVLGAEGKGLRRLTREKCDWLARLQTGGPLQTLNVSTAAAVALYQCNLSG